MKYFQLSLVFLAAMGSLVFGSGCSEKPVGTKERPFTMYFVPSVEAESISRSASAMTDYVSRYVSRKLYNQDTGFYIKSAVPTSYVAVVEAFGTGKADFAALNTFGYILAKDIKHYPVEVIFNVIRFEGQKSYKGQIITRTDSGIETLADLKGKKFAYTDPASTSGYILPSAMFKERGIQLGETVFASKHDNVVTMVYQGQVDAGATYNSPPKIEEKNGKKVVTIRDARARVQTQFPDVANKVKIIDYTMDVPNDPWVIRSNLSPDKKRSEMIKTAVRDAIAEFVETEEGKKTLQEAYNISGLAEASDDAFKDIRKAVLTSNLDLEKTLESKSKKKKKK